MERSRPIPNSLLAGVLLMTLVVLGLGGAVMAVKLRPQPITTKTESDVARWQRAVQANPSDDWAQAGLGLALSEMGRDGDAREAFGAALELEPNNWVALYQMGLLVRVSDPARALELLARAGEQAPITSKAAPLVALGDLRLQRGDAAGAKSAYRKAIADVPYLFDAHFGLARALQALGDREGALEQYREARRYDPSNRAVAAAIDRLEASSSSEGGA